MIYMLTQDSYLLNINSQASQKSGAFFLIVNAILPIFIRKDLYEMFSQNQISNKYQYILGW